MIGSVEAGGVDAVIRGERDLKQFAITHRPYSAQQRSCDDRYHATL